MSKINIHNKGTQTHSLPGSNHTLKPGDNHIPSSDWEAAKRASSMLEHHIKDGTLVELKPEKKDAAADKAAAKADAEKADAKK